MTPEPTKARALCARCHGPVKAEELGAITEEGCYHKECYIKDKVVEPTKETEMEDRFDKEFGYTIQKSVKYDHGDTDAAEEIALIFVQDLKDFIRSEISLSVKKERERVIQIIEKQKRSQKEIDVLNSGYSGEAKRWADSQYHRLNLSVDNLIESLSNEVAPTKKED